jgi:transposase-like protein
MVLGAVQRGGDVRLAVSPGRDASRHILQDFVKANVKPYADAIYTDSHPGYDRIGKVMTTDHQTVKHSLNEWVKGDVHTNTVESVWSLLDRAIVGSYHKLSVKHLPAYLDEFAFRFNNRENPFLFRDTLRKLCTSEVLGYQELIAS